MQIRGLVKQADRQDGSSSRKEIGRRRLPRNVTGGIDSSDEERSLAAQPNQR